MRFESRNEVYEKNVEALLAAGLTKRPVRQVTFTDEPKFPEYSCSPAKFSDEKCYGSGHSKSHSLSKLKAIAECIERSAFFHPHRRPIRARYVDDDGFVDPADFVNFSDAQLKGKRERYLEIVRKARLTWLEAFDYTNDRRCLTPAQTLHFSPDFRREPALREQNTTGAAFGFKFEDALLRGLLEVVERDAFMLTYLKKVSPPKIDSSKSEELVELERYLKRYNLELKIFDITTDLKIPAAMGATIDRTGIGPVLNIGAGADLNLESAAIKAAYESVMARGSLRFHKETKGMPDMTPKKIGDETDRAYYWYPVERIDGVKFLLDSKEKIQIKRRRNILEKEKLGRLLSIFRKKNYRVISADCSQPAVSKKGWAVVKVVVPELHPFYLGEGFKALYSVHAGEIPDLDIPPHPFL